MEEKMLRRICFFRALSYPITKITSFQATRFFFSNFMPKITLLPGGQTAEVPPGTLLLNAGEAAGVEMEAGCFNCSCGTCAIEIVSGMENIDPPTDEELNVLDQWNKDPDKYRLTCCNKILKGEVVMRMEH